MMKKPQIRAMWAKQRARTLKCQKNRTCVKQPGNEPHPPANTRWCTGCDKPGGDK